MTKGKFLFLFTFIFLTEILSSSVVEMDYKKYFKSEIENNLIFSEGEYFEQCHSSTVIHFGENKYMIAYMAGSGEGKDDSGIWLTNGFFTGEEMVWGVPVQIAKIREEAHWNPVLFKDKESKIYLFFKVGREISIWETWVITSEDNGKTWSKPYELVENDKGGRGPVRSKPITLSNGTIIAGASFESNFGDEHWNVFVDKSYDNGRTWSSSNYIELDRTDFIGKGVIQPTIWESENGLVHMLVRSTNGRIYRSDSNDYGEKWSELYAINIPNNNSAVDVLKFDSETLFLAYNPTDKIGFGSRKTLNLAISYDNGITWTDKIILEAGSDEDEFSYPSITSHDNNIVITYTHKRKNISFRKFVYKR